MYRGFIGGAANSHLTTSDRTTIARARHGAKKTEKRTKGGRIDRKKKGREKEKVPQTKYRASVESSRRAIEFSEERLRSKSRGVSKN